MAPPAITAAAPAIAAPAHERPGSAAPVAMGARELVVGRRVAEPERVPFPVGVGPTPPVPPVTVVGPASAEQDASVGSYWTQTAPNGGSLRLSSQLPARSVPFSRQRRMMGLPVPTQNAECPVQAPPGVGMGVEPVGLGSAEQDASVVSYWTQTAPNCGSFRLSSQLPGRSVPFSRH